METVTISSKFRVVIPKSIRESLNLQPGQKVQVMRHRDRIELVPLLPIQQKKGFLRGIDTVVPREDDRL